jgi:hypothetical protein
MSLRKAFKAIAALEQNGRHASACGARTRQDMTAAAELAHSPYLRPPGRVRVEQSSHETPSCLASLWPAPRLAIALNAFLADTAS